MNAFLALGICGGLERLSPDSKSRSQRRRGFHYKSLELFVEGTNALTGLQVHNYKGLRQRTDLNDLQGGVSQRHQKAEICCKEILTIKLQF